MKLKLTMALCLGGGIALAGQSSDGTKTGDQKDSNREGRKISQSSSVFVKAKASPRRLDDFSDIIINSPRTIQSAPDRPLLDDDQLKVQVNLSCYGTNLRSVGHPMDGCATIHMDLNIKEVGRSITFNIPAQMIRASGGTAQRGCSPNSGNGGRVDVDAASRDIVPQISMNEQSKLLTAQVLKPRSWMVFKRNGSFSGGRPSTNVSSIRIRQTLAAGDSGSGRGAGSNGDVTSTVTHQVSADGKLVIVTASIPGEAGHCGGYVSPLMVFFDGERPSFTGNTGFPLYPGSRSYWVEPRAPGHFLALDRDGNGKIENANELFGNIRENNGFAELSKLDSNHDGKISRADAAWGRLVLWHDADGDGQSQRTELKKLSGLHVTQLSLNYRSDRIMDFGHRARIHETAEMRFVDSAGRTRRAEIADVWFGEAALQFDVSHHTNGKIFHNVSYTTLRISNHRSHYTTE